MAKVKLISLPKLKVSPKKTAPKKANKTAKRAPKTNVKKRATSKVKPKAKPRAPKKAGPQKRAAPAPRISSGGRSAAFGGGGVIIGAATALGIIMLMPKKSQAVTLPVVAEPITPPPVEVEVKPSKEEPKIIMVETTRSDGSRLSIVSSFKGWHRAKDPLPKGSVAAANEGIAWAKAQVKAGTPVNALLGHVFVETPTYAIVLENHANIASTGLGASVFVPN